MVDIAVTGSHQSNSNGYLATGHYQFNYDSLNLALNASYISQQYGNLDIDATNLQKNKYNLQASLNFSVPVIGSSLGASVSKSASWQNNKTNGSLSLFYRQALFSSLGLNAQVNHNLASGDNLASLMLSYFPQTQNESDFFYNNNLSYQTSYDDKTHEDTQVWQTQKQGNIGEGYNYTAALQKQDQNLSGFARYQYKNNNGIYTANYAQTEKTITGNVGVAGSLVTANNEVHFARPITDSFAVVKVNGTEEDTVIYQDGARFGIANKNKTVVIPSLQSRRIAKITIKPDDMGLGVVADRTEQALEVGVRTANTVEFIVSKFVAVEGNAYVLAKDGSKEYLEALPLEYTARGKLQESFIAKKGFFYLENVPTGEFNATVKRYKNDCTLHLTIPKTDNVVVKLGEIACIPTSDTTQLAETGQPIPAILTEENKPKVEHDNQQLTASDNKGSASAPKPAVIEDTIVLSPEFQLHPPAWLRKQNKQSYVLQVVAVSSSLQNVKQFAKKYASNGNWSYITKSKDGKDIYVLLLCCYEDKNAANHAKQRLDIELIKLKPIAVPLSELSKHVE